MSPGIRAVLIGLLLGLPGCTGVRFGCIGFGTPVIGVRHWVKTSRTST